MFKCKFREFRYLAMICIFRPYKNTMGFLNYRYFSLKFDKHAREFGIRSELEYAREADSLYGMPAVPITKRDPPRGPIEFHNRSTDKVRLRYNNPANALGFQDKDNYLKNYFRPIAGRQYFYDEAFNK